MPQQRQTTHKLATALGVSAVLWLAACGGSSNAPTGSASSHQSTAKAAQQKSNTAQSTASTATTHASAKTQTKTGTQTTVTKSATVSPEEQARHAAAARGAISLLASCLHAHGVHVPPQNTSGPNPTFDTKGVDTSTPQFKQCFRRALAVYRADGGKT